MVTYHSSKAYAYLNMLSQLSGNLIVPKAVLTVLPSLAAEVRFGLEKEEIGGLFTDDVLKMT